MLSEQVYVVQTIMSGISAFACSLVILLYFLAEELRTFSFKIIFWLNFNNLIKAVALMVPSSVGEDACKASAYFFYSSSLGSLVWNTIITLKLYQSIILKKINIDSNFKRLFIASFLVPYSCCLMPFFFDSYGVNGMNCLLVFNLYGQIFRFSLYYFPGIIATGVSIYSYSKIIKSIKENRGSIERDIKRLKYFPLILIITVIPQLIARFLQLLGLENPYILLTLSCIWDLSGFFDSLAYVITSPVTKSIKIRISRSAPIRDTMMSSI